MPSQREKRFVWRRCTLLRKYFKGTLVGVSSVNEERDLDSERRRTSGEGSMRGAGKREKEETRTESAEGPAMESHMSFRLVREG
jgi:hypothetical protein